MYSSFFTGYCAKKSALVIDFASGKTILDKDSASVRYPASLTKMMTIYLVFEAIRQGKISLSTKFKVSKLATIQAPSKLNLHVGEKIAVLDLIRALIVKSANDAAVVVAEGLCGNVEAFCRRMTAKARQLGMLKTYFVNPSGLPNPRQVTCAKDIATLGISLFRNFPQYWHLFSIKSFPYRGRTYHTHCKIINWCKGTDGGKTGFTASSGFNLFVTAKRYNPKGDSKRVFVVVMGGDSSKSRDLYAAFLINRFLDGFTICSPVKKLPAPKPADKNKNKTKDKKRISLMKQIDQEKKTKIPPPPDETIINEVESFSVSELLKAEKVLMDDIDVIYEDDEEVVTIEEEINVKELLSKDNKERNKP